MNGYVHRVLLADIELAYKRWCDNYGSNEHASFWKFIGSRGCYTTAYFSDQEKERFDLLLGPHYVTIIRIYRVRQRKAKLDRKK